MLTKCQSLTLFPWLDPGRITGIMITNPNNAGAPISSASRDYTRWL